ncbi:MAG: hypothetical protein AMS22_13195 [Thiotrichales bacterium SG8_50]|nr:MAG: hypothetical protein AMS22_13195 [Thiotrichales bacterium SG8_50]
MVTRFKILTVRTLCLFGFSGLSGTALAGNTNDVGSYGVDYAFLFLMSLSPDFAAANYTINNDNGADVSVSIYRLPFRVDLMANSTQKLQLEGTVAYQQTRQLVPTFPGENIDSKWTNYGGSLGLLYEQQLTDHLRFTPSLRAGVAGMNNRATYNGALTNLIKDQYEGTLVNWKTNASLTSFGLGLSYDWSLRDRPSHLNADIYHVLVDSFGESNAAIKFSESANMLAIKADMIFPTNLTIAEKRLDLVLLLGTNTFFGENRDTLGYTTSYQFGIGSELPFSWQNKTRGHVRLSGQVLWAENMKGWLVRFGYIPG